MSLLSLTKKKSVSSASSSSSTNSTGSTYCKNNGFAKFDEKKDYVRRCHMKKCDGPLKQPTPVSFCLRK